MFFTFLNSSKQSSQSNEEGPSTKKRKIITYSRKTPQVVASPPSSSAVSLFGGDDVPDISLEASLCLKTIKKKNPSTKTYGRYIPPVLSLLPSSSFLLCIFCDLPLTIPSTVKKRVFCRTLVSFSPCFFLHFLPHSSFFCSPPLLAHAASISSFLQFLPCSVLFPT